MSTFRWQRQFRLELLALLMSVTLIAGVSHALPLTPNDSLPCKTLLVSDTEIDLTIVKELASLYLTLFVDGEQNAIAQDRSRNTAIWKSKIRKTARELGVDPNALTEAIRNEVNQRIEQFTRDRQQTTTTKDRIRNQQQLLVQKGICDRHQAVVKAIETKLKLPCEEITKDELSEIEDLEITGINGALNPTDLNGLKGLASLKMTSSGLTKLPKGTFDQLENLQTLWLASNPDLTTLPPGLFDRLDRLFLLDIGNNDNLTDIPKGIFDRLAGLKFIFLNNSPLLDPPMGSSNKQPFNLNILSVIKTNLNKRHLSKAIERLQKRGVRVN